jgi:threonine/homoserine/homoserine lactone efflux protein
VLAVRDDGTVTLGAAVLSFAFVAGVLTVTPGLDTALVLRSALTQRRRDALATAAGVVAGLLVWGAVAAVGVSALLAASQSAYDVLRYAGAAYMVWLGARLLWGAVRGRPGGADLPSDARRPSAWQAARRGLLTNLLNPKVGAFYVALLPQFLPAGADPLAVGLLLAGVHGLLGMAWFTGLTYAAAALGGWLRRPRVVRAVDGITGATLVGFGVRLALPGH